MSVKLQYGSAQFRTLCSLSRIVPNLCDSHCRSESSSSTWCHHKVTSSLDHILCFVDGSQQKPYNCWLSEFPRLFHKFSTVRRSCFFRMQVNAPIFCSELCHIVYADLHTWCVRMLFTHARVRAGFLSRSYDFIPTRSNFLLPEYEYVF